MNRPIGVFDSGIGGLTVVKELKKKLPNENIVYLGDTSRLPYGTKSKETIIRFTTESVLFLLSKNIKLIVIACNTSSSLALDVLKRNFNIPILGVIQGGAQEAVCATRNKRIGVIGTRATIESKSYEKEIKRLDPEIKVFSLSCPLFVPLVEEGFLDGKITLEIAQNYLTPLKRINIDTLILGCTHYPLLKPVIRRVLDKRVTLVDSARQVACEAKELLLKEDLFNSQKKKNDRDLFYVTDEPKNFSKLAKLFLGYRIKNIEKVSL